MKSALCIVGMLLLCSAGHARDEVAVLDLQARDFDETEALLLSQRLRDALQKRADVIGRATLYERLAKNDMEASGCADDDCMSALGSAARVVWIVAGSVGPHGDKLRLEARLYSVSQGHLFSNAHRDADNLEQLRKREVIRLAEELWSSEGGTGMPWWLLLLGGGGAAAYVSLGGGDSDDNVDNGNDGNTDDALGSAEIVGTFAD